MNSDLILEFCKKYTEIWFCVILPAYGTFVGTVSMHYGLEAHQTALAVRYGAIAVLVTAMPALVMCIIGLVVTLNEKD